MTYAARLSTCGGVGVLAGDAGDKAYISVYHKIDEKVATKNKSIKHILCYIMFVPPPPLGGPERRFLREKCAKRR